MPKPASAAPFALAAEGVAPTVRERRVEAALRNADRIAGKTAEQLAQPVRYLQIVPHLSPEHEATAAQGTAAPVIAGVEGVRMNRAGPISADLAEQLRQELRRSLVQVDRLLAAR